MDKTKEFSLKGKAESTIDHLVRTSLAKLLCTRELVCGINETTCHKQEIKCTNPSPSVGYPWLNCALSFGRKPFDRQTIAQHNVWSTHAVRIPFSCTKCLSKRSLIFTNTQFRYFLVVITANLHAEFTDEKTHLQVHENEQNWSYALKREY